MKLEEPILMGFQDGAFNKDTFVQAEFKKLQKDFKLKVAIETGTCLGYTSAFLSTFFKEVRTIEIVDKYLNIAQVNRLNALKNVKCTLGSSADLMPKLLEGCGDDTMVFLDAHWQNHCPLKDELQAIADTGIEPCIAIHDFQVPNQPKLGYDSIGVQPFNFQWLKEDFDAIYGEDNYNYYYNSNETSTAVKRGLIYVTPKK
jgi:hypothetical protein